MITKNYLYLFLTLLFVVSCGGGGSSSNDIEPSPTPPVSEPPETCISYSTNTERCSLTHKGLDRYYLIYTPTTITNNDEAPVLFALHGYGSTAETHKAYTMHEPFADTNKTIVVCFIVWLWGGHYTCWGFVFYFRYIRISASLEASHSAITIISHYLLNPNRRKLQQQFLVLSIILNFLTL